MIVLALINILAMDDYFKTALTSISTILNIFIGGLPNQKLF